MHCAVRLSAPSATAIVVPKSRSEHRSAKSQARPGGMMTGQEMNPLRSLKCLLLTLALAVSAQGCDGEGEVLILWPGTDEFHARVQSLLLSIEEAHARLVGKTRDQPQRYFDRTPIFIVGDEYFFTEPSKTEVRIQGFYVNGRTGVIEYRTSDVAIESKQKTLPANPFTETTIVE